MRHLFLLLLAGSTAVGTLKLVYLPLGFFKPVAYSTVVQTLDWIASCVLHTALGVWPFAPNYTEIPSR